MVAKITCPTSVRRALNYNEQKVKQEKATCIHAGNFLKDHDQMNFYEKLERFEKQIELNQRAKTNTLHISLNFDPSDKMDTEKMLAIANAYMQKIGFGQQPYLVYQHHDAGHPHCHIVTTNIKEDGKRMDTYKIGEKVSEPARKALEQEYGLIKAEGRKAQQQLKQNLSAQKIEYGKSETKRSITNVLDTVINQYKYTSLAELNAVLRQYNGEADRGKEGSRIHEKRGLTYRILDEKGDKVGVPIKASSIYSKPTLANLEKKFAANEILKAPDRQALKTAIDWTLAQKPESLREFTELLAKERISAIFRHNDKGQVYGLTFIDHNTKSVFKGSDVGKSYSARNIAERFRQTKQPTLIINKEPVNAPLLTAQDKKFPASSGNPLSKLIEQLMEPESTSEAVAAELKEKEKRKRRSRDHDLER